MTAEEFRELALGLPETVEGSHMRHPDFRSRGRIFATLGYPDNGWGMVNLPPPEQQKMIEGHPHIFEKAKGAWGLKGSTLVRLEKAKPGLIAPALDLAWQHNAAAGARTPRSSRKKAASSSRA